MRSSSIERQEIMAHVMDLTMDEGAVRVTAGTATLDGNLTIPKGAHAVVLFAHGSGSGRHSPRNRLVARLLNKAKLATLLVDLLTPDEEEIDAHTARLRFDIELLAERLAGATDWLIHYSETSRLPIGYFGASTGAAAALVSAARRPEAVEAVVSRGGRPDLAGPALEHVRAPTLLIVGENDPVVIDLNEAAYAQLRCEKQLVIVPGATHLFEEPGALEEVADLARKWFERHLIENAASRETKGGRELWPSS
jgi:putative phosphoribosyl transferase